VAQRFQEVVIAGSQLWTDGMVRLLQQLLGARLAR
jgi:hypothetical protein